MERCGVLVLAIACISSSFCVHSLPFPGGSASSFERCNCKSIQFWLSGTTNGASKLFPYKDSLSVTPTFKLFSRNAHRILRLWLPKGCQVVPDNVKISHENGRFYKQNVADGSIEIPLQGGVLRRCLPLLLKCDLKTLCVGIDTRNADPVQSTQRKLLMYKSDRDEETYSHRSYGIVLSVFVFCSMAVLVALCGNSSKNSEESVARDSIGRNVTILSNERVQSMPRQSSGQSSEGVKPEVVEVKVEGSRDLTIDDNSNSTPPAGDVDLSLVNATNGNIEKDVRETETDGAVFGKQKGRNEISERENEREKRKDEKVGEEMGEKKGSSLKEKNNSQKERHKEEKRKEKEEKRKEKEMKQKERSDMRSKRSQSAPCEKTESKPLPKLKLSMKLSGSNSSASPSEERKKKDKKNTKKKMDNGSPVGDAASPFSAGNRNSFVHRELPKRPSEELDERAGPSDNTLPPDNQAEDTDDDNYELVVTHKSRPRKPNVPSSNPPGPQDDDNLPLYDSVDDRIAIKATAMDDTYETVETKVPAQKTSTLPAPELYESVGGMYEEPNIQKQRSFSDILPNASSPMTDDEPRKGMSLGRERRREDAPIPPPFGNRPGAESHPEEEIDPYTVTVKKGDHIIQETNIIAYPRPPMNREDAQLSPEEMDKLYSKVDKEKQKKDRMEAEMEGGEVEGEEMAGEGERMNAEGERINVEGASSSVCATEEHEYESMPAVKASVNETEDLQFYEEVDTKNNSKS